VQAQQPPTPISFPKLLGEQDQTRRDVLAKIESITGTKVLAYIANKNASPNFIDHNDPLFFNDILESVGKVEKLDLIIDSPGGDANQADKIAHMCRSFCTEFRVIIPNSAKSAATMLALASDKILGGYLSEIGPIDPQIQVVTPQGQTTFLPAQSIIDSLVLLNNALTQGGFDSKVIIALLAKLDPPILDFASKAIEFSKQFAEQWLSQYMLKSNPTKAKEVATALADNRRWLSHGRRIGMTEANNLGLNVEVIDRESELWKLIWEYYSRCFFSMNATRSLKMFETKGTTINFQAMARTQQGSISPQP
jgi:hypothetical protein